MMAVGSRQTDQKPGKRVEFGALKEAVDSNYEKDS